MVSVPNFGAMEAGDVFDVVARPIFFDANHEAHVMECTTSGQRFLFQGLLELGYVAHSLFRLQFVKQYPHPRVRASDQTKILDHEVPTWHSLRSTIDACSGIGALAQGPLLWGSRLGSLWMLTIEWSTSVPKLPVVNVSREI